MSLSDWERHGWLRTHESSLREVRELLDVVARDIKDSRADGISHAWRMNIAYNAALQAATAALAAAGYRASRDQHHYRVIQSLRETVGVAASTISAFDAFRKKRNVAGYERTGLVSDVDADAMYDLAVSIRHDVVAWLRTNYPLTVAPRCSKHAP